jgi:hypothetical protein
VIVSLLLLATLTVPQDSWLVGGWAPSASSCGSDREISFEANGTFSESDSEGVWSLAGSQLTVHSAGGDDFGRSEIVRVSVRSGVEMEFQWPDGTRAKFRRCLQ